MPTPNPNLGYGKPTEASIDQVNQWMRGSTWYQDLLRSMGHDPSAPVKLSKDEGKKVMAAAQQQGVVVDQGNMEVDPAGNFNPKGHKLRNTLIVAGLAGATIATMGAAGAFAGASGAASGGLSAGTAGVASSLPGAMAALPALSGGAAALGGTGAALGGGAALTGLSGGASGGVAASLPGAMATVPALGGTSAAIGGAGTAGIGSKLAGYGKNLLSKDGAEMASRALGNASQASAQNRGTQAEIGLDMNDQLERQLINREEEKRKAQSSAYKNAMLGDRASTWAPLARPEGISGSYQPMSQAGKAAGSELYKQAMARMSAPDLQDQGGMPAYKNLSTDPEYAKNLKPGIAERVAGAGSWALPLVSAVLNRK